MRNDATAQKHPACGGAHGLPGCVAALARCAASRFGPRLPWKTMSPIKLIQFGPEVLWAPHRAGVPALLAGRPGIRVGFLGGWGSNL